uniref:Protein Flattop n=1 Tax=Aquila chrysaetos chrysaetos TaxID=223781 RepID=A0A663EL91_AQUCH
LSPAPLSPQYEDAFSPHRLQNWSCPLLREGSTLIIADDRGHLLPTVPRSQASPWGTFVGTWDMPPRIPPARLDLTSRSATAAAQLMDRIRQPTSLTHACNGLRTEITGKVGAPLWASGDCARWGSNVAHRHLQGLDPPCSEGGQPSASHPTAGLRSQPGGLCRSRAPGGQIPQAQGITLCGMGRGQSWRKHCRCKSQAAISHCAVIWLCSPPFPSPAAPSLSCKPSTPLDVHTNRKHLPTPKSEEGECAKEA